MSPLRALAFAIKACKGRKEAQNQGLAMGLHVSVLLKQGCIYTWRRSGVPTSLPLPCLVRMVACGGDHRIFGDMKISQQVSVQKHDLIGQA
eukprot:symbB.v1.2.002191.t1/scaffold96.1/size336774/8